MSSSSRGSHFMPSSGMQYVAAEVAAVGDGDAQVADGAVVRDRRGRMPPSPPYGPRSRTGTLVAGRRPPTRGGNDGQAVGQGHGVQLVGALAAGAASRDSDRPAPSPPAPGRTWSGRRRPAEAARRRRSAARPAGAGPRPGRPAMPAQPGPGQHLVAHHRRNRVAGQPEHRRVAHQPEGERLGRADGDLHPVHLRRCGRGPP